MSTPRGRKDHGQTESNFIKVRNLNDQIFVVTYSLN